ncbi:hypothetical protein [Amycolatopsis sp. NPDC004625]|uniref:hypothetical protein n=1 Tax=Amycolatopsis sp. NPDC004625 TaxID=3154670 RepID=UPI0033BD2824
MSSATSRLRRSTRSISTVVPWLLVLAGCRASPPDGGGIPKLTVPPTASVASSEATPSGITPPTLPTAPSCNLLTVEEVRAALGGGQVQAPFGNLFRATNGFAGTTVDVDMCTWQQNAGPDPGRSVQAEVHTAASNSAALEEYQAAFRQLNEHSTPGVLVPVSAIGERAGRLPEWLVAMKGPSVFAVTVTPTADGKAPASAVIENLARQATARLGW